MSNLTSLLLYSLHAQTWTARMQDKNVTAQVKEANHVDDSEDVGNFNKMILPKCAELNAVTSWVGGTRLWFYANTAPWGESRGVRVGKAENYMDLMAAFGDRKAALEPLLDAFGLVYTSEIAKREYILQGMFNINDYPTWGDVRDKFELRLSVAPLPSAADVRVLTEIPQDVREQLEAEIVAERDKVHAMSIRHTLVELMTPIAHMAKQLQAYQDGTTKKIYASLLDNVREMADAAGKLNITRDPGIEALAQEARALVGTLTQKDLKESDGFRVEKMKAAEALADRIAKLLP